MRKIKAEGLDEIVSFYSAEKLTNLWKKKLPQHVAIIMDGNRRWAKSKQLPVEEGHHQGAENLLTIIEAAIELGLKTLTVYAFSTENWSRGHSEVEQFMKLLEYFLTAKKSKVMEAGIRLRFIGNLSNFPAYLIKLLEEIKLATQDGNKMDLIVALNYGGRDEICRAVTKLLKDCPPDSLRDKAITPQFFANYLDTAGYAYPELLIRTSGEKRISNFLLWQLAYTEIYFTDTLWPNFSPDDLLTAIIDFQNRERRLGGDHD